MSLNCSIEKIVNYAVKITDPEEIIIFGSMVNGNANIFSDIDLLIITESRIHTKEAIERIKDFAHQISLQADILLYTPSVFQRELATPFSFVQAIYKSGKIIYKKSN